MLNSYEVSMDLNLGQVIQADSEEEARDLFIIHLIKLAKEYRIEIDGDLFEEIPPEDLPVKVVE